MLIGNTTDRISVIHTSLSCTEYILLALIFPQKYVQPKLRLEQIYMTRSNSNPTAIEINGKIILHFDRKFGARPSFRPLTMAEEKIT